MADLSIVIPTRNGGRTLARQLQALVDAEKPDVELEIVVADNGSTDDTTEIVRSFSDRLPVTVVEAGDVVGANAARNRGVAASSGPWLVFCDADDEVDRGWITAMVAAFSAGGELIAGPIDYRRLNPPEVCAWRGAMRATIGTMVGFLPAAHSANLGMTRRVFDELGGMDERFQHGGDDIEFLWRAQLLGHRLIEQPDAIVHYRLRPGFRDLWRQALSYGTCEALLYTSFRSAGMQRRPVAEVVGDVWWLVSRLPFAGPRARRGAWLRRLGLAVGRIRGAIRYRTLWW